MMIRLPVCLLTLVCCGAFASKGIAQNRRQSNLPPSIKLIRDVPYADTDHPRQRLDLLLPANVDENRTLPVVVYVHGGAWRSGSRVAGHRRLKELVASGDYAGVSVGYRLTGDAPWPAQIHDCKAAIRWIRANALKYSLDSDRIGAMGDSAGGHLVAMLGTSGGVRQLEGDLGSQDDQSSRVQCVVDAFGPSDLPAMKDYPSRLDHDAPTSPEGRLIGGRVSENRPAALAASPIHYVTADDAPTLILHGDDDQVVPYNQSVRFAKALKQASIECVFITVKGAGHGVFRHPDVRLRERQFFDRHLRGKAGQVAETPIPN